MRQVLFVPKARGQERNDRALYPGKLYSTTACLLVRLFGKDRISLIAKVLKQQLCKTCPERYCASYWGRNFGVVAIKDHVSGVVLWHKFIGRKERISDYVEGIRALEQQGFTIRGIVSDGLKGLRDRLSAYRFQYCQFHQVMTVKHKLTSHPKLEASIELLDIAKLLCHTDKESFVGILNDWRARWEPFLNERTTDEKGRSFYAHKKT